ncbi:MAG: DNA repair protein RadC [Acholeplasmataceae bacterium]
MYMIKEMPNQDRPRERLIQSGVTSLSNEELIAILLRTGLRDESVMTLSKHVLYQLTSMEDLKRITVYELTQIKGIKEAKACTLLAAIELGRRLAFYRREPKVIIHSAIDIYHYFAPSLSHLMQEHFVLVCLSTKSELIASETVFIGTINQTLIHPREIFKKAIKYAVSAIIFVHNHPTGDSSPSRADVLATEQLIKAAELLSIQMIDHIIIGKDEYFSIVENKRYQL